ncbi:TetR family transcriptional regulator [Altererythrobacter sp. B11]|uniref:TetR/AcrR family transcriptional regulator n=1 Tax=Altererythrobacter sp. B11 TaxID=2060312 RepID=UPI000DC6FD10|nr:TetR family transcriptional regulator [Altererythrobacter sp. B11]BBC73921.1 TetR family transcriptional regulator [Altererythrobacter sp. B11]
MSETPASEATPRPGIYVRGTETVDAILKAALRVLIDEGAAAFTVRRIATECDMRVGNVSYHFPRKEMLVHVMLDDLMESYDNKLEVQVRQPHLSPEERLRIVIQMCLNDICTKRTTRLFTELWALANHNDFIADRVKSFYAGVHQVIGECVAQVNPRLSPAEVNTLSLFISASMEGTTPFTGYEKPWAAEMPALTAIAAKYFVDLAKTVKPGEIAQLTEEKKNATLPAGG